MQRKGGEGKCWVRAECVAGIGDSGVQSVADLKKFHYKATKFKLYLGNQHVSLQTACDYMWIQKRVHHSTWFCHSYILTTTVWENTLQTYTLMRSTTVHIQVSLRKWVCHPEQANASWAEPLPISMLILLLILQTTMRKMAFKLLIIQINYSYFW